MIPDSLRSQVGERLAGTFGPDNGIVQIRSVSGGCICRAAILRLSCGASAFLKWHDDPPEAFFQSEADGLQLLGSASPLQVPQVYGVSSGPARLQFLLMEDLTAEEKTRPRANGPSFDEELGHGLAGQHRSTAERFGFSRNNFIGITPQINDWSSHWPEFFRTRRIEPLLGTLNARGRLSSADRHLFDRLSARFDDLLATDEPPSLLHGDLWSGNILRTGGGRPALIDPAVYYGHREADLAYTQLFGGLSPRALAAYRESWPLTSGHEERGDLYNLYHLLNHALIFGGGYMAQARTVASRYL